MHLLDIHVQLCNMYLFCICHAFVYAPIVHSCLRYASGCTCYVSARSLAYPSVMYSCMDLLSIHMLVVHHLCICDAFCSASLMHLSCMHAFKHLSVSAMTWPCPPWFQSWPCHGFCDGHAMLSAMAFPTSLRRLRHCL